jgi:pimeloyl-ACP methyl ester carboxylesterase
LPKANVNGITFHYQQSGKGPDVILIHGLTGDLSHWYFRFIPSLSKRYRVTAYDLRGHGLSDISSTGYNSSRMAEDLNALMDHLGIDEAFLVGHSYGGVIAMAFAAEWPQKTRGITIYDTGFPALRRLRDMKDWADWDKWGQQLSRYGITPDIDFDNLEPIIERFLNIPLPFGLRKGRKRKNPRLHRLVKETTAIKEFQEVADLTEERLLSVSNPVLAIYGTSSPVAEVGEYLAENLKNCRLEYAENERHLFVLKNPEVFLSLVEKFLDEFSQR